MRIEPAGTRPPNAIWPVSVPEDEFYEVYANWRSDSNYGSNAPYAIAHADGLSTYLADQTGNGGTWMPMGSYRFEANTAQQVEVTDQANGASLVADAIKLVPSTTVARTASWSFQVPATGSFKLKGHLTYLHEFQGIASNLDCAC